MLWLVLLVTALVPLESGLINPEIPVASAADNSLMRTKVNVPDGLRSGVFATDRYLNIPPGFSISVYARIPQARFMAITPDGNLLVSQPGNGTISLVRDGNVTTFAGGLRLPHDLVFHTIGNTTYLYFSESNQISRAVYNPGDTTLHNRQVIITGLPDASNPELRGVYGHPLKNLALDPATHKLYVAIASTCNACLEDTTSNPRRGAIYQYDADGSNGRLYAQGLRNAEGLAFVPGSSDLWVVVNNRDNLRVPDPASPDYKKVVPGYVDNHPPEEFVKVRDGGNYGWPFCNPTPDSPSGYDNMPFQRDVDFNADGHVDCNSMDRINKGIQAHSAPLGLTFLQDTLFPQPYRNGVVVGLHGSWNRTRYTGYKVVFFPWDNGRGVPGSQSDLVSGWLDDNAQSYWGRPVDMAVDHGGNMFISDDQSGTIYRLSPLLPPGANFADPSFGRVWQRTDKLVADGALPRSFIWGPAPYGQGLQEEYAETPGGKRLVQYFDKARMEINNSAGDQGSLYYVTTGLLVREMVSGQLQSGDNRFESRQPAEIPVAGDPDDVSGPTYKTFANFTGRTGNRQGQVVTGTLDRGGNAGSNEDLARYNVTLNGYINETGHNLASPFATFLNQPGPVLDPSGQIVQAPLFQPPFYVTGFPISEAFWVRAKVGGQVKDVLVQMFERRVLTYTPSNPAGWQVEMGNAGLHYYRWRYGSNP